MYQHGRSCLKDPILRGPHWLPKPQPPRQLPEARRELIERIRREIAAGTYDTPEKWEAALERLQQRLEE